MVANDELKEFLGEDYKLFQSDAVVQSNDILYCLKLTNIKKKNVVEHTKASGFSSMFSSVTSSIQEKVAGYFKNSYFIAFGNDNFKIITALKEIPPVTIKQKEFTAETDFKKNELKLTIKIMNESVVFESGEVLIKGENPGNSCIGSLKDILLSLCHGFERNVIYENALDKYVKVIVYKNECFQNNYFNFSKKEDFYSLLASDDHTINLLNSGEKLESDKIISCCYTDIVTWILYNHESGLHFYQILQDNTEIDKYNNDNLTDLCLNREGNTGEKEGICSRILKESTLRPTKRLLACSMKAQENDFLWVLSDDDLLIGEKNSELNKAAFFIYQDMLYLLKEDLTVVNYVVERSFIDNISNLEINTSNPFRNSIDFAVVYDNQKNMIEGFSFTEGGFCIGGEEYSYSDISEVNVIPDEYNSSIKIKLADNHLMYTSFRGLVYELWKRIDKSMSDRKFKGLTLQSLYKEVNDLRISKLLMGTFGELAKADRMINKNNELFDIMVRISENEKMVLRSSLASLKSRFVKTEDLQQELLVKVSEIELQRKMISKLLDEWTMVYPHYLGQLEVKWLKYLFGDTMSSTVLERERWRIISNTKRIIQQAQYPIIKYLNEIQLCTSKLQEVIPDEIKKVDTSRFRRLQVSDFTGKVSAGTDVALGLSAGVDAANILLRGAFHVNPIAIAISTKMLVDNYIKDENQRRNIKIFGYQTLSWWETIMNSLDIVIIETKQGMENLLYESMERDKAYISKLPENRRENAQQKLARLLTAEYQKENNEKFMELIPNNGVYVINIIKDIEKMYEKYEEKLNQYGETIYS